MDQTAAAKDALGGARAGTGTTGDSVIEARVTEELQTIEAIAQNQTLRMDLMEAVVERTNLNKAYQRAT